ncbi:AsmA family protein [Insolitispirillum peregrinum]|uniref:Uncharacterized protein involved in outer membrane biogenesis n=1 Tax=Insolitispirillum peregrinum TaxID=80876 RepID=A0A1N7P883_9PROT|nr:AsmA family protein [Insolitispirillum peregrinum]SIT06760.1 Uncharacterized protein involved in outer membrane biogenesis [Insolitispirillum peregrinum]
MGSQSAIVKKVAGGLLALVGFLFGALLAVPWFINGNSYKGQVTAAILDATGRQASVDGDIVPSALPWPTVRLENVRLANRSGGSQTDMVQIAAIDLKLSLAALFTGRLQVEEIHLDRPQVLLEQTGEGANWEFFSPSSRPVQVVDDRRPQGPLPAQPGTHTPVAAPQHLAQDDGPLAALTLVAIHDGTLRYRRNGQDSVLDRLSLETGIESPHGPFKAEVEGTWHNGKTKVPLRLDASIGDLEGGKAAPLSLRFGLQKSDAAISFSGLLVGSTAGRAAHGELRVNARDTASLARHLGLKEAPATGPLTMRASTQINGDRLSLDDLTIDIGDSHVQGSLLWDRSSQPYQLSAKLALGSLDLDRWQQALKKDQQDAPPPETTPEAAPETTTTDAPSSAPLAQSTPFSLPIPSTYRGTIDLRIGALTWRQTVLRQGHLAITLDNKGAQIDELTMQLPGSSSVGMVGRLSPAPEQDGGMAIDLSAQAQSDDFRSVVRWLGGEVQDIPNSRLNRLQGAVTIGGTLREIAFRDAEVTLDTTTVRAAATVRPPLRADQRPAIGLTLAGTSLNLDAYRGTAPPAKPVAPAEQTPVSPVDQMETAPVGSPAVSSDLWRWLRGWDANLRFGMDSLTWHDLSYKGLHAEATLQDGQLVLHDAGVRDAAGGSLQIQGGLDVTHEPTLKDLRYTLATPTPQRTGRAMGLSALSGFGNSDPLTIDGHLSGPLSGEQASSHGLTMGMTARLGTAVAFDLKGSVRSPLQAWSFQGSVDLRASEANRLIALWDDEALRQPARGPLELKGQLGNAAGKTALHDLSASMGRNHLQGTIDADWISGPRPRLVANLRGDRLDFRPQGDSAPVAPAGTTARKPAKRADVVSGVQVAEAGSGGVLSDAPTLVQVAALPAGRWSTEPLDRSPWQAVDAELTLKAAFLAFAGVEIDDADLAASLQDGVLTLSRLKGGLYGGPMDGSGSFNVRSDLPKASLTLTAQKMQIDRLLKAVSGTAAASGQGNLTVTLAAHGISEAALINSLNGEGSLDIDSLLPNAQNGQKSALVAPVLALNQFASLAHQTPAAAATIKAAFKAQNGIISVQNADLGSALYQGRLRGLINLPQWTLDLSGEAHLSEGLVANFLQQKLKLPSSLPISLSGPLDQPNVRVMTGAIDPGRAAPAAVQPGKQPVSGLLEGLLGTKQADPQQPAVKPEKAARDLLKGILGQ